MISVIARQVVLLRGGNAGQATLLLAIVATAILSLTYATVYLSHMGAAGVASANASDALAISAATWEARGLNMIAALNDGILQCFRVIRWTCVVWAALAVAACTGAGMPAFAAYSRQAIRTIRSYWRCARELADWSVKVRAATPALVLAETVSLSKSLKVTGTIHPFDPRGPHDGRDTLELHVSPGPPLYLVDALGPIAQASRRIRKWTWAGHAVRQICAVIDGAIRAIVGGNTEPIRMLVPESDFRRRQNVRFAGTRSSTPLPIPDGNWSGERRFLLQSFAEPYGGNATEMTWRSRLTEKPEE
ncbi:MAG: hypothetical protein ACM3NF_06475 [Gemmatimonadota bacterium]